MSKNLFLEKYSDFIVASERAKKIAIQFKERTILQKYHDGWAVLVSRSVLEKLKPKNTKKAHNVHKNIYDYRCDDFINDDYDDDTLGDINHVYCIYEEYDDFREEYQPLLEEGYCEQDDWARSDEEGWYYSDND